MSILALTLRFALAIVLGVAAFAKVRDFDSFTRTVAAILPWRRGVPSIAAVIVATEAVLAVLLAVGRLPSVVALATLALFLAFAGVSLWATRHDLHVNCNCFGKSERELGTESLVTSLLLAAAALVYLGLLQAETPSPSLGELTLAVGLGVGAVLAGRWAFAMRGLAAIVRQRRALERDLAHPAGELAR